MKISKFGGFVLSLFLGCALFDVTSAFASEAGECLQKKLNNLSRMKARFKQVVRAEDREISRSSGSMALHRPGKFRWDTKRPMAQLVIADGNKLWIYDVELEQVTVKKQSKGVGGTPALFLSGVGNTVDRDFVVQMKDKGNHFHFDLKAREEKENIQRIKMVFKRENLVQLVLYDQLGQQTEVNLSRIKQNPSLPASLFKFKPPKGVDVVQQ